MIKSSAKQGSRPLAGSLSVLILAAALGSLWGTRPAGAATKPLSVEQLKAIQSDLKGFDQLSLDFTQQRFTALRKKTRTSKGQAQFAKPNRFRW